MKLNLRKLFLISSSTELTLLKLGPFLTMSDILMDIINGGLNISSGNPASAAIGYAMLLTCFLYPGKDVLRVIIYDPEYNISVELSDPYFKIN